MSEQISPELVERMVAHFPAVDAKYAHYKNTGGSFNEELREVRAIVAELPTPVDPDLIEARQVCASISDGSISILSGDCDGTGMIRVALAAIKRGRELATGKAGLVEA